MYKIYHPTTEINPSNKSACWQNRGLQWTNIATFQTANFTSQVYILALLKKIKHTTVIIVHNFKDAEEIDDLESMVDCDIKGFNLLYRPDAFGGILFILKSILYLP